MILTTETEKSSKSIKEFLAAIAKLDTKELVGIATLLGVKVWTDPVPLSTAPSDQPLTIEQSSNCAATNPFVKADRSQPRPGEDILWEMCEKYIGLPRPNRRNLLRTIKTAGRGNK